MMEFKRQKKYSKYLRLILEILKRIYNDKQKIGADEREKVWFDGWNENLNEFKKVGELITKVIDGLSKNPDDNSKIETEVQKEVVSLCSLFPIYKNLKK